MKHSERAAQIAGLRAQGMTYREIAEATGLAESYTRKILNSAYTSSLAASAEAKRRRVGVCEQCGGQTRYNGHRVNGPSRICATCSAERATERQWAKRGTGSVNQTVLAFLEQPHTFTEIREHLGVSRGYVSQLLHRLHNRYGLVERISRGVYVKASPHGNPVRSVAAVPPIPAAATGHKEHA